MKKILHTIIIAIMLIIISGATSAQTQHFNQTDGEAQLMRYIDALNQRDYAAAYAMWESPRQTYADFVAGFDHTERIVPYFGFTGAAAGSAYVTTVLLGYQTDGTVESYYGYFQLANGGNYSPPRPGSVMVNSQFQLVQDGIALHNSTVQTLLSSAWQQNPNLPNLTSMSEMSDHPADVLLDYYDLINFGYLDTAYNRWLSPAHGLARDYRQTYQQFAAGYRDTRYVTVYTGYAQAIPENQRHNYLWTYLPAVLVGQHTDGSYVTYSGCYALGYTAQSPNGIGIVNGDFQLLQNDVPNATNIFNALNTLNCAALGMGL
jgi:hypothetical protein